MQLLAASGQLFALILIIYLCVYFIGAGLAYWFFYILKKDAMQARKIQLRMPDKKTIIHEIKWSLITIGLLSFTGMIVISCVLKGYTKMYHSISDYGWAYFFGSIVCCIFINDAYFYWVHRFMHLKAIFPAVHRIHHLSHTPTPWSIFSFSPVEACILYAIFPVFVFFVPLHPVALSVIVLFNVVNNISGHLGYEIVPGKLHRHWLFKYSNTVTHHEWHHAKVKCNYGLYFNIWDRLMKTNHPDNEKKFMQIEQRMANRDDTGDTTSPHSVAKHILLGKTQALDKGYMKN